MENKDTDEKENKGNEKKKCELEEKDILDELIKRERDPVTQAIKVGYSIDVANGPLEYCFPGETRVEMGDGSMRPIAEILPGDSVRCWDARLGTLAEARVERVLAATVYQVIRLNDLLAASPAHRILTSRGYQRFDEIVVGDHVFERATKILRQISRVEALCGSFSVFNLVVERSACFFAEGLLVEDQVGVEGLTGVASASAGSQPTPKGNPRRPFAELLTPLSGKRATIGA